MMFTFSGQGLIIRFNLMDQWEVSALNSALIYDSDELPNKHTLVVFWRSRDCFSLFMLYKKPLYHLHTRIEFLPPIY